MMMTCDVRSYHPPPGVDHSSKALRLKCVSNTDLHPQDASAGAPRCTDSGRTCRLHSHDPKVPLHFTDLTEHASRHL